MSKSRRQRGIEDATGDDRPDQQPLLPRFQSPPVSTSVLLGQNRSFNKGRQINYTQGQLDGRFQTPSTAPYSMGPHQQLPGPSYPPNAGGERSSAGFPGPLGGGTRFPSAGKSFDGTPKTTRITMPVGIGIQYRPGPAQSRNKDRFVSLPGDSETNPPLNSILRTMADNEAMGPQRVIFEDDQELELPGSKGRISVHCTCENLDVKKVRSAVQCSAVWEWGLERRMLARRDSFIALYGAFQVP